jgi:hypothetical protein
MFDAASICVASHPCASAITRGVMWSACHCISAVTTRLQMVHGAGSMADAVLRAALLRVDEYFLGMTNHAPF